LPLLRRDDHRAGGRGAEHLPGHGLPVLDVCPRLAAPADDRGAARVGVSKKICPTVERAAADRRIVLQRGCPRWGRATWWRSKTSSWPRWRRPRPTVPLTWTPRAAPTPSCGLR